MRESTSSNIENCKEYKMPDLNKIGKEYLEDDTDEDFCKYLLDRMKQLESRANYLKEQCDQLESEKKIIENEKLRYEREVRKMQAEIDRLKKSPLVVGTLISFVDDDRVLIKSSTGPEFIVGVSKYLENNTLKPGSKVALNQNSLAIVDIIPTIEDPEVFAMQFVEKIDDRGLDYSDIGGLEKQIQEIVESVEVALSKPELFDEVGISPPRGVLLYGEPGTGKTLLAKAVANRTDATFLRVVGSELVQKYIGDGSKLVREIFETARKKAPSIIFIDELDAIAAKRLDDTTGADREVQRTLMQLLAEMDGFYDRGNVKIIAATNRPDVLDPAILRPGRFDRVVCVPLPDIDGRKAILKIHTKKMKLSENINFTEIASRTEGASGADLSAIVMEAGMFAVRAERGYVTMNDFVNAIDKVMTNLKVSNIGNSESMFV